MEIVDKYINDLYVVEEINYLLEFNFKSLMDKFKKDSDAISFGKKLKRMVDPKNPKKTIDKVKSLTKHIKIDLSLVDKLLAKSDKDFLKRKQLSSQILKNSLPKANPKSIDTASTFLSFSSVIQNKNKQVPPNQKLKTDIKQFVGKVRKFEGDFGEDDETPKKGQSIPIESVPDYAIGIVIIMTISVITWMLISGTAIFLSILGSAAGAILSPLGLSLILLFAILAHIFKDQTRPQ